MDQQAMIVDLDLIDRDHRMLRELIDRLQDALTKGCAEDEVQSRRTALSAHLDAHMEFEEGLMLQRKYPLAFSHAQEHKSFREQFALVLDGVSSRSVSRDNVAKLLTKIHDHHVTYSDAIFCHYLIDKYSLQIVADGAGI